MFLINETSVGEGFGGRLKVVSCVNWRKRIYPEKGDGLIVLQKILT